MQAKEEKVTFWACVVFEAHRREAGGGRSEGYVSLQRSTAACQAPLHALRPWHKRRWRRTRQHR